MVTFFAKNHFPNFTMFQNGIYHRQPNFASLLLSYKQLTELTILCFVNKACAMFLFTFVKYTGKSSFQGDFLSAVVFQTF